MSDPALFAALDATWPAAEIRDEAGWRLRRGAGGGKRVSAASRLAPGADPDAAVAAMARWGQGPLFQVRGEAELDEALAARGYAVVDPTVLMEAPVAALADARSEIGRIYRCDRPAVFMEGLWAAGGIGPARLAVMARAAGPRAWLFLRLKDQPVGVGFVALRDEVAMIHAVEITPRWRRQGGGAMLLAGAANFAADHGATRMALAVTEANAAARALYAKLGMREAGRYHYRAG